MSTIKLKSSDGVIFEVDLQIAKRSKMIEQMIAVLGTDDLDENDYFPLPNVTSPILELFIEWCTHHKNDSLVERDDTETVSEWDENFFKVNTDNLKELILAANYLDVTELLSAACVQVAKKFAGKTPEQIKIYWNNLTS
ncbi:S-phase kinase-associated protein 1-like [Trichogramma pretiosum]|uniref:S-phase kinase-associated protein 1-like n=1 Tax=Trichogramma pretiosum TaxID=7493 RepID=UPI0006C9B4CE|nr:S-phase kinase-associated protein 1-like [Trichogramma pretiosum]